MNRDKNYWEEYYKKQNENLLPSLFAKYVMNNLAKPEYTLIELGCGNGRDALFFANEKLNVIAYDQCEDEICFLQVKYAQLKNIQFKVGDFSELPDITRANLIYSRFTLHSISKEQEQKTLIWVYRNLTEGGYFCIEVRGKKNEIYKLGKKVENEEDSYIYNNHYRRFLNLDTICTDLKNTGFVIEFAAEKKGFAPFAGKDETYIRIIAKK
ncbi:MAG: class I SAM-dependent methyltransferase [Bacteroidales bacterium]|jgi:ubiquinone/menaquinone biosynthesis C-methylase UbiE|nr:class I SAM-dependent methyltransferase [Bacteroidales bacterium]